MNNCSGELEQLATNFLYQDNLDDAIIIYDILSALSKLQSEDLVYFQKTLIRFVVEHGY